MTADLILHMLDVSHPRSVLLENSVQEVLGLLGAQDKPCIIVLNKVDELHGQESLLSAKRKEWPDGIFVSALEKTNFSELLGAIENKLQYLRKLFVFEIPIQAAGLIHQVYEQGQVLERRDLDGSVYLRVNLPLEAGSAIQARLKELNGSKQ